MSRIALTAVLVALAGCVGRFDVDERYNTTAGTATNPMTMDAYAPPLDPSRKVNRADCSQPVDIASGNLMCRQATEAELRARKEAAERAERERLAKIAAAERAERERLERERLAREEAARKARAAEEARIAAEQERLAAERRRLEEEAARKAREARELEERKAAEALARQRAEQEAREAAERERQRLEEEWLAGRAYLANFVATYGKVDKFKGVAGQINGFLDKTR